MKYQRILAKVFESLEALVLAGCRTLANPYKIVPIVADKSEKNVFSLFTSKLEMLMAKNRS